jgi:hypothetical protein
MKISGIILLSFITGIILRNLTNIQESNKMYRYPVVIASIIISLLFIFAVSYIFGL